MNIIIGDVHLFIGHCLIPLESCIQCIILSLDAGAQILVHSVRYLGCMEEETDRKLCSVFKLFLKAKLFYN